LYGIIIQRKKEDAAFYDNMIDFCWAGMGIIAVACFFRFIKNNAGKSKASATFPLTEQSLK